LHTDSSPLYKRLSEEPQSEELKREEVKRGSHSIKQVEGARQADFKEDYHQHVAPEKNKAFIDALSKIISKGNDVILEEEFGRVGKFDEAPSEQLHLKTQSEKVAKVKVKPRFTEDQRKDFPSLLDQFLAQFADNDQAQQEIGNLCSFLPECRG